MSTELAERWSSQDSGRRHPCPLLHILHMLISVSGLGLPLSTWGASERLSRCNHAVADKRVADGQRSVTDVLCAPLWLVEIGNLSLWLAERTAVYLGEAIKEWVYDRDRVFSLEWWTTITSTEFICVIFKYETYELHILN